jgi:hypothetical protein
LILLLDLVLNFLFLLPCNFFLLPVGLSLQLQGFLFRLLQFLEPGRLFPGFFVGLSLVLFRLEIL